MSLLAAGSIQLERFLPKIPMMGLVLELVALLALTPITVRRLHDRGRPGWTAVLFLTPFFIGEAAFRLGNFTSQAGPTNILYGYWALLFIFSAWYVIEIGMLRGTVGSNRYGADPVGTPEERYSLIVSGEQSRKQLVTAFARDPMLIAVHEKKTSEDLLKDVIDRGPPVRLDAYRLLLVPLLVSGVINAAIRAAANPYSYSGLESVGFWPVWIILVPVWLIGEHLIAMSGWEARVKAELSQSESQPASAQETVAR